MKTLRELINLIESADRDRDSYQPGYIPGVRDPEDGSDLEPGLPGVTKSFFGIDDKIKAKIQDIVVKISDMPGMWDHQAQTFTDRGMAKLKAQLKDNPRYIRYAVNLTADDYEAESVQEGRQYKNKSEWMAEIKRLVPGVEFARDDRGITAVQGPGKKIAGEWTDDFGSGTIYHDNIQTHKKSDDKGVAETDNDKVYRDWRSEVGTDYETTKNIVDPSQRKVGKAEPYHKSRDELNRKLQGEPESALEETQQMEEDPIARIDRLFRDN